MKTSLAIQCIVLLACMAFCSSLVIPKCRCVKTSKWVNPSLIAHVHEFDPRPYCNKKEVIVTQKDGSERCLDPKSKFTEALLKLLKNGNRITVSLQTTTSAPTSVPTTASTAAPTAAPTAASTTASTTASTASPTA